MAAVTLLVGLAVGYAVGHGQGRGTAVAPDKPPAPAGQAPGAAGSDACAHAASGDNTTRARPGSLACFTGRRVRAP